MQNRVDLLHVRDELQCTAMQVYNVTPYLKFHPGGMDWIMKGAGFDATPLFNKYHAWVNAEFMLEKCLVGYLVAEPPKESEQQ